MNSSLGSKQNRGQNNQRKNILFNNLARTITQNVTRDGKSQQQSNNSLSKISQKKQQITAGLEKHGTEERTNHQPKYHSTKCPEAD